MSDVRTYPVQYRDSLKWRQQFRPPEAVNRLALCKCGEVVWGFSWLEQSLYKWPPRSPYHPPLDLNPYANNFPCFLSPDSKTLSCLQNLMAAVLLSTWSKPTTSTKLHRWTKKMRAGGFVKFKPHQWLSPLPLQLKNRRCCRRTCSNYTLLWLSDTWSPQ